MFFIRLLVYGSIPIRFLWVFLSEQKLAFRLALIEARNPEEEVRLVKMRVDQKRKQRSQ